MNSLPDDPEAEILERLRGPDQAAAPPSGEEADQEMVPGPADLDAAPEAPPDYATDDQNQLEREIETPPE
jgi:hypothetical protein